MTKLLSEQELRDILSNDYALFEDEVDKLLNLINSQKIAYGRILLDVEEEDDSSENCKPIECQLCSTE